jgi:16S rRNA U1498 N3-methylase RsmE
MEEALNVPFEIKPEEVPVASTLELQNKEIAHLRRVFRAKRTYELNKAFFDAANQRLHERVIKRNK